ncbi:MAG: TIGR03943 family protein [Symploca sp. SIO2E9]|nr:TIGR03943 family protein [Symploca sp. SIO2E9]
MSSNRNTGHPHLSRPSLRNLFFPLLDILALAAWGILMLKYWLNGKLNLLIHPNYSILVIATGLALLMFAVWRALALWVELRQRALGKRVPTTVAQHTTLFPPGWSSALLLTAAIAGLLVTPKVFASQTAIKRGVTDLAIASRVQPQAFGSLNKPQERSLIEWVRTLYVYPEPDAYTGQSVKVQGFVVHPPNLPPQYLLISRFVITCCAADAYPVGLVVKLDSHRQAYPPDTWLEIKGQMITETLDGKRQLAIAASSLEKITEPKNPYYY